MVINTLQYDARYTQRHINALQYDARYTHRHINTLQYDARYTHRHINTLQYDDGTHIVTLTQCNMMHGTHNIKMVNLTTGLTLMPRLRVSGAVFILRRYVFMALTAKNLPFFYVSKNDWSRSTAFRIIY